MYVLHLPGPDVSFSFENYNTAHNENLHISLFITAVEESGSSFTAQFLFSWLTWMQHSEEEICENACLFNACKEIG
jgi:hypothetical protein